MNDIYSYSDYRQFLKDYYDRNKASHPGFSYRLLAQRAGINSSSYFKFVIDGKRNLSQKTLIKICQALRLKEKEAEYFESLVFFNQSRTPAEKSIFFEKMLSLQKYRNVPHIKKNQLEFFQEFHHCVVRELVTMRDFSDDFAYLGKMVTPPISAAKAEASVKLLLELGFLGLVDGKYVQVDPVLSTGPAAQDFQVIRWQIRMMQLAIETFERSRAEERTISSSTMGVSRATFDLVVNKIRDFRAHLMEVVSRDENPERVYQLTIAAIPLSDFPGDRP
jgi:uncharacterized protein (TIGR02147 family)